VKTPQIAVNVTVNPTVRHGARPRPGALTQSRIAIAGSTKCNS
jgi:hypothetical protein